MLDFACLSARAFVRDWGPTQLSLNLDLDRYISFISVYRCLSHFSFAGSLYLFSACLSARALVRDYPPAYPTIYILSLSFSY